MKVVLEKKGMKKALIAAVTLGIATSPMAVAHADTGYKVVVNGQDITNQVPGGNTVQCGPWPQEVGKAANDNIWIQAGLASAVVTPDNQVVEVTLTQHTSGNDNWWRQISPAEQRGGPRDPGDASVTKNGKNYKITGHITPVQRPFNSWDFGPIGNPVPFEFDATCP